MRRGERTDGAREVRAIDPRAVVDRGEVRAPSLEELATGVPLADRLDEALLKLAAAERDLTDVRDRLSTLEAQAAPTVTR